MILSFGIGPTAAAPSYSIRIPFTISHGRRLKIAEGDRFELLGHECEIAEEHAFYVLTVSGFESEEAAASFLPKACAGLIWYGLKHATGIKFNINISDINLLPGPHPIEEGSPLAELAKSLGWEGQYDGDYDADKTTIRPDHKRLVKFQGGSVTLRIDSPIPILATAMKEGVSTPRPELVLSNPKLRLACEVYLASHFESTSAATFLSRITTLEILISDTPASEAVRELVEKFKAEVIDVRKREKDAERQKDFDPVISGLSGLLERSITSRIRDLVAAKLGADPDIEDSDAVAKEVAKLYALRSNLVHSGVGDQVAVRDGANRLNDIVPRILRACFREIAKYEAAGA